MKLDNHNLPLEHIYHTDRKLSLSHDLATKPKQCQLLQETLLTSAAIYPDHIALISGNLRMSYREVNDCAFRLSYALRMRGINRGDRVAIFMDNTWQCAVSIYGILLAGGVFVPINIQTKQDKLAFIIRDADAHVLLSEQHLSRVFSPVIEFIPTLQVFCINETMDLSVNIGNVFDILVDNTTTPPTQLAVSQDLAALIYTSGTTGEPKGVMHTHQSLNFVLDSINEYLGFSQDERLFSALPLNFGYGLFQWLSAVRIGATLILERSFAYPAQVFKRMCDEAVTSFAGVPTVFAIMLALDAKQSLQFPSVRRLTNAAAALPIEFIPGLRRIFPNAGLYKMYGQTECIRCAYLDPDLAELKPESVGCAIPGTELLLLDDDGCKVAIGEVGNLYVRGPHLMKGYWKQPEKTAEVLVPSIVQGELMLKSGDLFRQDADGDFYFVARKDEIIKSRGEKVSPVEVENAIYRLSAVQDVLVIGLPDLLLGEAVCAFVAAREGQKLSVQQIKHICSDRLENFMVPKHVFILSELPRTANGKLSRKLLIDQSDFYLPNLKNLLIKESL